MKITPSVNSSIAGNWSMNCWPVNRSVLQVVGILLLNAKMLCIYCIGFIKEKKLWCFTISLTDWNILQKDINNNIQSMKMIFKTFIWPHDHKIKKILKAKFQTRITFVVVLLMNWNFKDLFKNTFCSHLQIIKTVCPI